MTSAAPPPPSARTSASRRVFLDRLRGLAVVVMIEVHVVNALLATDLRGAGWFRALDRLNGLVAPTFLFCAGLSLALVDPRRRGSHTVGGWLASHARRCAGVALLGYAMHASYLPAVLTSGPGRGEALAQLLQADILQVIAISLFTLAVARATTRSAIGFTRLALVMTVAAFAAAPLVRGLDVSRLPVALRPYISSAVPSQFPLLPWVGYAFAGAAVASASETPSRLLPPRRYVLVLTLLFVTSAVTGALWRGLGAEAPGRTRGDAVIDLALISCVGAALAYADTRAGREGATWTRSVDASLRVLGHHSLAVYVVHVAWVYGRHPASLRSIIGPTLGVATCALAWLGVTVSMVALARVLHARRRRRRAVQV
jgi:uncharacterized membrane protein